MLECKDLEFRHVARCLCGALCTLSFVIFALAWLQEINLSDNQLTGSIPSSFAYLSPSIQTLDLSWNQLSGFLPSALALLYGETGGSVDISLGGNSGFLCPIPTTSIVYDTATCTCAAGWTGPKQALDGDAWNASLCRDSVLGSYE